MTIDEAKIKIEELACYARTKGWNDEYTEAVNMAIKALEQEPCEDAISRQAAIELFAKNADAVRPYSKTWEEVKALPPVTPQPNKWIPVSERLPEQYKEVIVTDIETSDTYRSRYIGDGYWECDNGSFKNRVIAWMPLPEPYKAEGSDKE